MERPKSVTNRFLKILLIDKELTVTEADLTLDEDCNGLREILRGAQGGPRCSWPVLYVGVAS